MIENNTLIKLLFGFKIKHLRSLNKKSYQELSIATGLSTSYLNDIEKGKKYPKPDKIQLLAQAFDVDFDELVSTKPDKKLRPVIELFSSDFFKFFPLDEFGISVEKLLDLFTNAPDRVSAFISTILKMVRSYQIEKEEFYRIALRSYQDIHNNYFKDLEDAADNFRTKFKFKSKLVLDQDDFAKILNTKYGITIDSDQLAENKKLTGFRSYFDDQAKKLFLNKNLNASQINFILVREIGFQFLKLGERPFETRLNKEASFDKLLNNFKASYFAAAILIPENEFAKDIQSMARESSWNPALLQNLQHKYNVTAETLLQRFTNILPGHFDIGDLFFIRLVAGESIIKYNITKELHLSQLHNPFRTEVNEHLCNRWISISAIKNIHGTKKEMSIDAQISNYWQNPNAYFCMTITQASGFNNSNPGSITLGLLLNDKLKSTFNFITDPKLKEKSVHTTCERCSMTDCDSRVAPPIIINKMNLELELEEELQKL